jgi:hypothetical protein
MPSRYQRQSLQALLGLFLESKGHGLPEHNALVSPSALSRFLNRYAWSTRAVIRRVRAELLEQIKAQDRFSCPPLIHVVLDLTT